MFIKKYIIYKDKTVVKKNIYKKIKIMSIVIEINHFVYVINKNKKNIIDQ